MYFEALKTFQSDETQSEYAEGLRYTARTEQLQKLVPEWVEKGLVKLVDEPGSFMRGKG